jgi:DNA polymerase I-like protein with 3'-5' exonuclease and polymerase domains
LLIYDTETNGLLDELTTIHCLHMGDPDTGQQWRYSNLPGADGTVEEGLRRLQDEPVIAAHNHWRFDLEAIRKVYPWFQPKGYQWDTLALATLVRPKDRLKEQDSLRQRKGTLPEGFFLKGYFGTHTLGAFGYRFGVLKGEYDGGWETLTPEMDDYCAQDVAVTIRLWREIVAKLTSVRAAYLENEVLRVIAQQERNGVGFDMSAAEKLEVELMARRAVLDAELRAAFKPWWARKGGAKGSAGVVKRSMRRKVKHDDGTTHYEYIAEGAAFTRVELRMFNPASRQDIAGRLQKVYGWEPTVFTDSGQPEISEETLDGMHFPEAKLLKEYLMVDKRIGQLSTGKQALIGRVAADGRIHGRVNTNQAVTGRMTHAFPNLAQVPGVGTPYGREFRSLFRASAGRVLVGCDAEGLELRCLAHFMAKHDGGSYGDTVVNGDKKANPPTDVHSVNQRLMELDTRDGAKTAIYAMIYGGGDPKLGIIKVDDWPEEKRQRWLAGKPSNTDRLHGYRRLGKGMRNKILEGLPALAKLADGVKDTASKRGYLIGLDGRKLPVRKAHAALNTVLQSAGALAMKLALVLAEAEFARRGWMDDGSLLFVLNIHDEFQIETTPERVEDVKAISMRAIEQAGIYFGFRCPLAGSADDGVTWADTH